MLRSVVCAVMVMSMAANAEPYEELTPRFDRIRSRAMVRRVAVPSAANLDYAAYDANPVRYDPQRFSPKVAATVSIERMSFSGRLQGAVDRIEQTPLSAAERAQPLAWRALENRLWDLTKDQGFQDVASRIASEKFGDREVFKPFQEIVAAYVHESDSGPEFWVRIEFMPWVRFLEGISDEDGDGFREIYGRLVTTQIPPDVLQKAFAWIRSEYTTRVLERQEIVDWINVLASYWYPTLNTDIVEMGGERVWPASHTERFAVKQMRGVQVHDAIAVVRGNPFGKAIYNVYVVPGLAAPAAREGDVAAAPKKMDTRDSEHNRRNRARFKQELDDHGASYDAWAARNAAWLDAIRDKLGQLPQEQMGVQGRDDWVFFRKSLEYMVGGDLDKQPAAKNPLPHLLAFQKYLAEQNTNMLFVAIPNKVDVYYEQLGAGMPDGAAVIINPYGRKFLRDATEAGIEVIDVLPHLLAAKAQDAGAGEELYQRQDTHWTNRGLQVVAELIADRVRAYSWYEQAAADTVAYEVRDTTFSRRGDIVDKLPEARQGAYPPVTLRAQRVYLPDGEPYAPANRTAPLMLIGDSFTGVFELVDCKSAGIGSAIAARTGVPVDIITSWGGGPLVRQRMLRARRNDMDHKRLVIYLMVSRDLYNYAQSWEPLDTGK